ncbi:hypothetical protein [Alkalihalobacillus sp. AL-G]|uniref:hypothetical protein n=1 Tax=Alkalihalobacillus sp. AL-G TaxID=2926399 RepID=UPI00272CEB15|nr:hypothetical protein [Alkalihalobacillus sp. AL-G]WLD92089.1 hypothetical protein MOJ78_13780 [Alkalihalobacillus sp. AL-G]
MKKLVIAIMFILLFYSIYFDLKVGTLPTASTIQAPVVEAKKEPKQPYKDITVSSGETVLTILERIHEGKLPVPIQTAVKDFEKLNVDTSAQAIQANRTYRFPIYR